MRCYTCRFVDRKARRDQVDAPRSGQIHGVIAHIVHATKGRSQAPTISGGTVTLIRAARTWYCAATRYRSLEEQPGREFPSAIATTRTTDEALQVPRFSTALSLNPRRRLQCVQRPTPSDLPPNPALISRSGHADVAPRDRRSVNRCGHAHLACKVPINVTVPCAVAGSMAGLQATRPGRAQPGCFGCGNSCT